MPLGETWTFDSWELEVVPNPADCLGEADVVAVPSKTEDGTFSLDVGCTDLALTLRAPSYSYECNNTLTVASGAGYLFPCGATFSFECFGCPINGINIRSLSAGFNIG